MNKRQKKKNLTTLVRGLEIGQGLIIGDKMWSGSKYHFYSVGDVVTVLGRSYCDEQVNCIDDGYLEQEIDKRDILIKRK